MSATSCAGFTTGLVRETSYCHIPNTAAIKAAAIIAISVNVKRWRVIVSFSLVQNEEIHGHAPTVGLTPWLNDCLGLRNICIGGIRQAVSGI